MEPSTRPNSPRGSAERVKEESLGEQGLGGFLSLWLIIEFNEEIPLREVLGNCNHKTYELRLQGLGLFFMSRFEACPEVSQP